MKLINPSGRTVDVDPEGVSERLARGFRVAPTGKRLGFDGPDRPVRLCAVYSIYNEAEYIAHSLKDVYAHADRIVVLHNTHPWAGPVTEYPDDGTVDIVRSFPDPDGKIDVYEADWHDSTHGGQLAQRTFGFSVLDPGDWYWLVDGDEFYHPDSLTAMKELLRTAEADCVEVLFYTFFQTFRHVGYCDWMKRLFRVAPGAHFIAPNTAIAEGQELTVGRLDSTRAHGLHCGYIHSDRRMYEKVARYEARSRRGDFYGGFSARRWFDDVWKGWRKREITRSVHITEKYAGALKAENGPFPTPVPLSPGLMAHPYHIPDDGLLSISVVTHGSEAKDCSRRLKVMLDTFLATVDFAARPIEVIWTDNATPEAGYCVCERLFDRFAHESGVSLVKIRNAKNQWYTAAHNQFLAVARGAYLMLLNPDLEFYEVGWLEEMIADLHCVRNGGIVGPKMVHRNGTIHHAGGYVENGTYHHIGRDEPDKGQYDARAFVHWLTGACLLFRREVYIACGPLDARPAWKQWHSDNKYCEAAREAGFEVIYSPAEIVHDAGASALPPLTLTDLEAEA